MPDPDFRVVPVGGNCYTINDGGRTVALISSQGYIDWLLRSPMQDGPLIDHVVKETHLCYTLGLKMLLISPGLTEKLTSFSYQPEADGQRLVLSGRSTDEDGKFESAHTATLYVTADGSRYEWGFETTVTCTAGEPVHRSWLEYNNIYPGKTGRCMLFAPTKEYDCTLMVDHAGVVWRFPHQHLLHYSQKIGQLEFGVGTMAGFFGEPTGSPVVAVLESSMEPDWAICDMYYDLHCGARPHGAFQPGQQEHFRYLVKYLGVEESDAFLARSKQIPVTDDDWKTHTCARLELGRNTFSQSVRIDRTDDASGFRQNPPTMVWDREEGHSEKGSLRISNAKRQETIWSAEPPTQVPPENRLRIAAMVKTKGVEGEGMYIRVRYHTFVWHPEPHIEWPVTLESVPVDGTTPGWVKVTVPELHVPSEEFDYLVWIDVILEGQGIAWLTDVDIDLEPAPETEPELEEGSSGKRRKSRAGAAAGSGAAV